MCACPVYDETIRVLKTAVGRAKLGREEMLGAIRRLDAHARILERTAASPTFEDVVASERARSRTYGGRMVGDDRHAPHARSRPLGRNRAADRRDPQGDGQLRLL